MSVVHLPEVLTGMEEAVLTAWYIAAGDNVAVGQPFAEIETEKATVEYLSEVAGTVEALLVEPGQSVAVGAPIVRLVATGAPPEVATGTHDAGVAPAAVPIAVAAPAAVTAAVTVAVEGARPERLLATPLVRRLAREHGFSLTEVVGSGPGGRIVRRDVEALIDGPEVTPAQAPADAPATATPPATTAVAERDAGFTEIPHTGMRRAIARRLSESKATVPHFYLQATCQVDALLELRRNVNATRDNPVSVNDFVVKAVAGAMRAVPAMNATWGDEAIRVYDDVDIAVAVSIDGGLVTPVVRGVDRLSVGVLSETIKDLAGRAREGRLRQHELEGGTFSISNLGMYGIEEFAAIINPPHAGILAVGAITERPVVDDGRVEVARCLTVTLSGDHRVVDGAVAAHWLTSFKELIEAPLRAIT